jgi:tRNA threonylcarbamoyladenosine biosynthesis protein TsaE
MKLNVSELSELPSVATKILEEAQDINVFLFYGDLGAGKTSLIKEICLKLGSDDNFSSPTYSIINEYIYPEGKIYHLDLYRIRNTIELLDIGLDEILGSGNYCFFEWPELAEDLMDGRCMRININVEGQERTIETLINQY